MRKIVAGLFMSLDGVVEMPEQSILPYFSDELVEMLRADQDEADAILLGRRTYEEFAAYWPDKTAADDPFADYINRTPKLVVSKTLRRRVAEHDPDRRRRRGRAHRAQATLRQEHLDRRKRHSGPFAAPRRSRRRAEAPRVPDRPGKREPPFRRLGSPDADEAR